MNEETVKVETPWGAVGVSGGCSQDDDGWSYRTADGTLRTRYGDAVATLWASGDGRPLEHTVFLEISGGVAFDAGAIHGGKGGETFERDGRKVAWLAQLGIDASDGSQAWPMNVRLWDADAPREAYDLAGDPPRIHDEALAEEVEAHVADLLRGWVVQGPNYAAGFLAAAMRAYVRDKTPEVVEARLRHERLARQVRDAETLAAAAERGADLRRIAGPGPG